jgi:hypothetical protein
MQTILDSHLNPDSSPRFLHSFSSFSLHAFLYTERTKPMSTDTRPNSPTPVIRNHSDYYLPGGDLFIQVDEILFRVHLHFFTRESDLWRNLLGSTTRGRTANNPIDLVNQMPSISTLTAETFANFLWVFYNPRYSLYETTEEVWKTIFDQALCWNFQEVERLCWRELSKIQRAAESYYDWHHDYDEFDPEAEAIWIHLEDGHERS